MLDEALLGVCRAYPAHTDTDVVFSKVAIINRAYRANLRFVGTDAEKNIAKAFVKNGLDSELTPLAGMAVLNAESLPTLVHIHGRVVSIVRKVTHQVDNSFVSKYLHFHLPAVVPVFDVNAYAKSWELAGFEKKSNKSEWEKWNSLENYDYGFHCASVVILLDRLRANGIDAPSLRLMDVLLYGANS